MHIHIIIQLKQSLSLRRKNPLKHHTLSSNSPSIQITYIVFEPYIPILSAIYSRPFHSYHAREASEPSFSPVAYASVHRSFLSSPASSKTSRRACRCYTLLRKAHQRHQPLRSRRVIGDAVRSFSAILYYIASPVSSTSCTVLEITRFSGEREAGNKGSLRRSGELL